MNDLTSITKKLTEFRQKRDWEKYHKPKDIAISLVLEVAEVIEHFQWKSDEEIERYIKKNKEDIGRELADVLHWVLILAHDLKIDIFEASSNKIAENNKKYPINKTRGKYIKYTKL